MDAHEGLKAMHLLGVTHTLAPLGALSAQIPACIPCEGLVRQGCTAMLVFIRHKCTFLESTRFTSDSPENRSAMLKVDDDGRMST